MKLAGRYLNAAQQLGDAAILSPLVQKQLHRPTGQLTYDNIQGLANDARNQLKLQMKNGNIKTQPITPQMLYKTANDLIDDRTLQLINYPSDNSFQELLKRDFDTADPGYFPPFVGDELSDKAYKNKIEAEILNYPDGSDLETSSSFYSDDADYIKELVQKTQGQIYP